MNKILSAVSVETGHRASNNWVLSALALASTAYTATSLVVFRFDGDVSRRSDVVWMVVFALLVVLWAYNDSAAYRDQWAIYLAPYLIPYAYFSLLVNAS